ncbi:MAG TPA: hypothetical protein VEI02_10410, partial [Planctomycetota bacterium]|nr:hypothetical protein [Planctomycetota bacterium]
TEEGRPVGFDRSRDGAATFRYVVPQAALRAVVDTRSTELLDGVAEFAAAAAGAELAVDVPCGEPALVVAGRVLCDDGAPFGGAAVWIVPSGGVGVRYPGHRVYGATATTTDDGTFRTGLSIPRAPLPRSYFVEARHPSVRIPRERVVVTGTVVDGVADLGTIVVKRPVILCAGVVVDAQGAPVPFADVSFFRLERLPPQIETSTYGKRADAAGRFEIAMQPDAPAGPARALGASVAGMCAFDLVPFETGARDLRIVAKPSGELIGSFRFRGLDQASPRPKWSRNVTVRVTGAAARGLPAYIGSADADGMNAAVQGGSFTAYHLREGEARVEFRLGDKGRVLLAVENVAVRGGEIVKDPRLQDVDLTAALELVAVSVVDEAGAPVPTAEVHLQDEAGEWSRFEVDTAGRVDAPFAADARDAYVLAPGFGARRLRAIPTPTTVRLQRAAPITVAVRLADDTPFEIDGESVGASIHYLGPEDASDAAASAFRGHPFNQVAPSPADLSRAPFDARRLVHLEVWGPGVYEIRPILHHSRGWSTLSMPDPPKTIAVVDGKSEAPVVLSVPLEVLKEARARRR